MLSNSRKSGQSGFTLVEIAIVLVIIGLLLGGIIKGQEMITQAKIKNVINDFNGLTAAIASYQDRYRAVPGDDRSSAARWSVTGNGNGDGQFDLAAGAGVTPELYNNTAGVNTAEVSLFWRDMRLSGFVPGATTGAASLTPPNNAVSGLVGVQTTGMGFTSNIVCTSNLPDKIAIAVDTQMDDQSPATGQLRGMVQAGPNPATGAASTSYFETGTNQYLVCKNL